MSGYWYLEDTVNKPRLHFYDKATGQTSNIVYDGHAPTKSIWTSNNQIFGIYHTDQTSPRIHIVQLQPTGATTLPTSVSLVKEYVFGDANSRIRDIIQLESGAVVVSWGQQELFADRKTTVAYLAPGATNWQITDFTSFIPSSSGQAVMAQHPVDKSLWLFADADAYGVVGAIHMTEVSGGLRTDWTNNVFIRSVDENNNGPDPENPTLAVSVDKQSGEIVLAYQSDKRERFWNADRTLAEVASWPVFVRIKPDATKTFQHMPIYLERVGHFNFKTLPDNGLAVAYQPFDTVNRTFDTVNISTYRNGTWDAPIDFGKGFIEIAGINHAEFVIQKQQDANNMRPWFVSLESGIVAPIPPTDKTPPTEVKITGLPNGYSGTVNVGVTAKDNNVNSIGKVELLVDGSLAAGTPDTTDPFSPSLDTTKLTNGLHSLVAKAYDLAGNSAVSGPLTINVYNSGNTTTPPPDTLAPAVTITSPINNAKVGSSATITAAATDNVKVTKMEVYVDGKLTTTAASASINYGWNTKRLKRGAHTVLVKAYDAAGNIGNSQVVAYK
jgi:hypothetical protein